MTRKEKTGVILAAQVNLLLDECYHILIVGRYVNHDSIVWILTCLELQILLNFGNDGRDATSDSLVTLMQLGRELGTGKQGSTTCNVMNGLDKCTGGMGNVFVVNDLFKNKTLGHGRDQVDES